MDAGPWLFGDKLLVLKEWSPQLCLVKEQLAKVPIWAQFYQVPLKLWSEAGLSYVASAVGVPLHADSLTEECQRLSYAKICVEVDVGSDLPDTVNVEYDGKEVTIGVKYPWKPVKCMECHLFGHPTEQCVAKDQSLKPKRTEWVVKSVATPMGDKALTDPVPIEVIVEDVGALEMLSEPQPTTALCDKDGLLLVEEMEPTVTTPAASLSIAKNVQLSGKRSNNSFAALADVEGGEAVEPIVLETFDSVLETVDTVVETFDTVANLEEFIPVVATKKGRGRGKAKGGSLATKGGGGDPKL